MRTAIPIALAALAAGCAPAPLSEAPVIVPRPAPLEPEPPVGTFGPVLSPAVTVPYRGEP